MKRFLIFVLLVIGLFAGCAQTQTQTPSGTVYFTISDPGDALEGVTSIKLTVSGVGIHKTDSDTWVQVLGEERVFDLIELKLEEVKSLAAEANISPGRYNQVRLDVSKVMVTIDGEEKEAKLPSSVLKINTDVMVVEGEEIVLNFDFLANESLHMTGSGQLIMAPVLKLEEFSGAKIQRRDRNIEVTASRSRKESKVGMDAQGEVGAGKGIAPDAVLATDDSGSIVEQVGPTGNVIFTVKDKANKSVDASATGASKNNMPIQTDDGLEVTSLMVTISKLSVHKASDSEPEEAEWIVVSSEPKTFSLLELQDVEAILGESELEVGKYTQIRLEISEVTGTINGEETALFVPSSSLKLVGMFEVTEEGTSIVSIDFLVDRSVHMAGSRYIMRPVIKLVTLKGVEVKSVEDEDDMTLIDYEGGEVTEETEIDTEEEAEEEEESSDEDGTEDETGEEDAAEEETSEEDSGEEAGEESEEETDGEETGEEDTGEGTDEESGTGEGNETIEEGSETEGNETS